MTNCERTLAGIALALIGNRCRLTAPERVAACRAVKVASPEVNAAHRGILIGGDPLGADFSIIRSPVMRRAMGATYTPPAIVNAMVGWAAKEGETPARVVNPGAGSGRYLRAAAQQFPNAALVAVEIDPLAALLLRANAAVLGFADRLQMYVEDYRAISLPKVNGPTLFIGNPPYVRHHEIGEPWKHWFASNAATQGFKASKLAGLHIHFFLKTWELALTGDFGALITAAEWLDVNYGSILRKMLADGLGGAVLIVIDPKAQPFGDVLSTGAITCFRVGNRPQWLTIHTVDSLCDLAPLSHGAQVSWSELSGAPRWSYFVRSESRPTPGFIELGELFSVHRGQVTGSNATWIESVATEKLPVRFLRPTITKARELIAAGEILRSAANLRRVLDLPVDLSELTEDERKSLDWFLRWARTCAVHKGFVASHRSAWWAVQLRAPAPILCTYMARNAPSFVINAAKARHLNIAHGLYPRGHLSEQQLSAVVRYLRQYVTTEGGRVYAGGLVKFEPRELERLRIPALEQLREHVAESMDASGVASRRRHGERRIPA